MTEKNEVVEQLLAMKEKLEAIQESIIANPGREITQEVADLFEKLDIKTQELADLYDSEGNK
jgi:hypothetical protein